MSENTKIPYKIYLEESEMPTKWYNLRADMQNKPAPLLNPATQEPMTEEELSVVFCKDLVEQELDDTTAYFEIPQEIQDFYKMYRPSPLVRAYCLEKALDTPAKIYYKFEGNNTSGSHKLNSAIAQAYYAKKQGTEGRDYGDRGRTVGNRAFHGLCVPWPGLQSLYGKMFLRAEAVPPRGHADVRGVCDSLSLRDDRSGTEDFSGASRNHRKPGMRDFRGGGGGYQP